jgi:hypothetical protein
LQSLLWETGFIIWKRFHFSYSVFGLATVQVYIQVLLSDRAMLTNRCTSLSLQLW